MIYEFIMYQSQIEDHSFWVAESKVLNGCVVQADTPQEAYKNLELAEEDWLETAKELGWNIPDAPIRELKLYSGKAALRISPMVHRDAAKYADEQGISLNQYFNNAILAYNERSRYSEINKLIPVSEINQSRTETKEIHLHQWNQTAITVNLNLNKTEDIYNV